MKLQVFFAKFWPTTTAQYFTPGGLFKAFFLTFTSLHNLNEIASVFCQILAYHDREIFHTWGAFQSFYFNIHITT